MSKIEKLRAERGEKDTGERGLQRSLSDRRMPTASLDASSASSIGAATPDVASLLFKSTSSISVNTGIKNLPESFFRKTYRKELKLKSDIKYTFCYLIIVSNNLLYFLSCFHSDRLPEEIEAENLEQGKLSKSENKVGMTELNEFIKDLHRGALQKSSDTKSLVSKLTIDSLMNQTYDFVTSSLTANYQSEFNLSQIK